MKKIYPILLLLVFVFLGCTKKSIVDNNVASSVDSLSLYLSLANDINVPFKSKQEYNKKAFDIIINQKDDSVNRVNLFKVANRYYNMNDWNAYRETTKLILERSKNNLDTVSMAKAYAYLGDYYSFKTVPDSAFRNYYKAEKLYIRINDDYNLARTFLSKATLQYNISDFFESEIMVFKALRLLKRQKKVSYLLHESYNLLGILYKEREEYDKALEFNNKALVILEDKSIPLDLQLKATSLNNIGFVYLSMNDYKKAKIYFQKGLEQKNLFKEKLILYAMLYDNLAYSKFKLHESEGLPDLFYKSLKIRDSLDLKSGVISSKIHLSEYFAYKKDTSKAMQYCKDALKLSRNSNRLRNTLEALKQMALVDPTNASVYSKEYIQINEKAQKAERKMGEKFSRIEYETNEIKDENTSLNVQNRTLIYVFSICGLLGLFFYVYLAQKAKNRELLFKQQQQIANEDIYNLMISQQNTIEAIRIKEKKKVAQDLHDGVLGRMFGVRISLDSLDKVDDAAAAVKRKKYLSDLKEIEQDIREISHDLNKEKSELINNFVMILDKLLENQRVTFKSKLISSIDSSIRWDLVSNSIKINLYRIIQEALQNCNKYAQAETIKIELKNEVNHLALLISDDGVGFNVNRTKKGIGLQNIFYRVKECDGTVDIKSNKADGTVIVIKIPIDQKINLQHNDN
ncbi:tetratricopeptide repeat-containing sensor histidine kinase [Flavobacterium sp. AJR]|uniref:tetratricopeptide repeat-containing sensor histidine kinase n=1 Tax=Flavobacterium sp. AJR TaxID=1979369 RepID=UPI000A3D7429|nr:tetratricopeptide repeat-containing sensor histidine kinase [Flavobacterium sp. AJR]OUL60088.1 sensor histidine kinase [Flavobacterium sp. AJR]